MSFFQSFILGLVQGITEFLPISSSGHLIFIPKLFGWAEQGLAFDAAIHLATLAAVLAAFWAEVKAITFGVFKRNKKGQLGWLIAAATLPVLIAGFFFSDWFEFTFRSPIVVAASLAVWGVVLWVADVFVKEKAENDLVKIGRRRSLVIGLAQIISLIPGTSRSGITITAGLFGGLSREAAARFSFLLGIPSIAAAGLFSLFLMIKSGDSFDWLSLIIAFATAFISGFFAIRFLLLLLQSASYKWFAIYRIILAVAVMIIFGL